MISKYSKQITTTLDPHEMAYARASTQGIQGCAGCGNGWGEETPAPETPRLSAALWVYLIGGAFGIWWLFRK
jgi:hypothetical protein